MIISEKQIIELMQAAQTLAFIYITEERQVEGDNILRYLRNITDQQSEELKVID